MYTLKINTPVYTPKGEKPRLKELVDTSVYDKLVNDIDRSVIPRGIKSFLTIAAARHYKFDYSKIAEYYAHAGKDVQQLFEDSGLVIIDFDSAIANGFVMMNKKLMEIRENEPKE